jgi:hypothetical protein
VFYNILISVCPILALSWLSEKELSKDHYAGIFFFFKLSYQELKSFVNAKHNNLRKTYFFSFLRHSFIKIYFTLQKYLHGDFKK